jgi:hypothetical protein
MKWVPSGGNRVSKKRVKEADDFEAKQRAMREWAELRVVGWDELRKDDYDFGFWAKSAQENLLEAGCVYEYARESHYFRRYLVLRKRPLRLRGTGLTLKFEGSTAAYEDFSLRGWDTWLTKFDIDLIANKSFAEVLRSKRAKVQKMLGEFSSYSILPGAVELPGRYINHPGSQITQVQIFWERYNNEEIGEEMKRLAEKVRPAEMPEPERRGLGKLTETLSLLDALSAMRLASHMRKRDAVKYFSAVQLGGIGREGGADVTLSNLNKLAAKARAFFASIFPYGEDAENAIESSRRTARREAR